MVQDMPWIKMESSKKITAVKAKPKSARGHKHSSSRQEVIWLWLVSEWVPKAIINGVHYMDFAAQCEMLGGLKTLGVWLHHELLPYHSNNQTFFI